MKRSIIFTAVLGLFLVFSGKASADFTSTLDFEGFFHYDGSGITNIDASLCNAGFGGDLCGQPAAGGVDDDYFGIGALAYELDLNLPEDPNESFPWWLEVDFGVKGEYVDGQDITPIYFQVEDYMLDLGEFPLGINNQNVVNAIDSIPGGGSIPLGADEYINFLFEGDEEFGILLVGIEGNPLYFDDDESLSLYFGGQLKLTAHEDVGNNAVPEPATMLLFGSGMFSGIFLRRKKNLKS